jgi:hypothetical protein
MPFDAYTLLIFLAGSLAGAAITLNILAAVNLVRIVQFKRRHRRVPGRIGLS